MVICRRLIRSIWDQNIWKYTNTKIQKTQIRKLEMQNYKNYKKKTNLKADDEEVMVISRRFIRSIWEAAAILLAVIIAPLRELFHSPNFNHHPTLTLPFHHPGNLSIIFQLLLHHHHHHHHHHNPTLTSPFSSSLSSTSSLHHHPTLI